MLPPPLKGKGICHRLSAPIVYGGRLLLVVAHHSRQSCAALPQSDAATGEIAGVFVTRQVSLPATCRQCSLPSAAGPVAAIHTSSWGMVTLCVCPASLSLPASLTLCASLQLADDDLGAKDPATIEIEGIW